MYAVSMHVTGVEKTRRFYKEGLRRKESECDDAWWARFEVPRQVYGIETDAASP